MFRTSFLLTCATFQFNKLANHNCKLSLGLERKRKHETYALLGYILKSFCPLIFSKGEKAWLTSKGENSSNEGMCAYCISAINYSPHYLRLSHYLDSDELKMSLRTRKVSGVSRNGPPASYVDWVCCWFSSLLWEASEIYFIAHHSTILRYFGFVFLENEKQIGEKKNSKALLSKLIESHMQKSEQFLTEKKFHITLISNFR